MAQRQNRRLCPRTWVWNAFACSSKWFSVYSVSNFFVLRLISQLTNFLGLPPMKEEQIHWNMSISQCNSMTRITNRVWWWSMGQRTKQCIVIRDINQVEVNWGGNLGALSVHLQVLLIDYQYRMKCMWCWVLEQKLQRWPWQAPRLGVSEGEPM